MKQRIGRIELAGLLVVLLTWTVGCQHEGYNASALPAELRAPTSQSVERINLSNLAGRTAPSEMIQPGDLLQVTVTSGAERDAPPEYDLRVADDGTVEVPSVGAVRVAGLTPVGAEQAIRQSSMQRGIYVRPAVATRVIDRRSHRVTVMGAVSEPGMYPLPAANSDLLAAIAAAGGLTEEAGTVVEIRQPTDPAGLAPPASMRVDLSQAVAGESAGHLLHDGAVVTVPKQQPQRIQVMGLVRSGGQFEIPPGEELRLLDSLALAGGRTLEVADKVTVVRSMPGQTEPVVIEASVGEAKRNGNANIRLAGGDLVSVDETPLTFTLETMRSFLRFGFSSALPIF